MKSTVLLAIGALALAACATATTDVADVDAAAPATAAPVEAAAVGEDVPENAVVDPETGEVFVSSVPLVGDPEQIICKVRDQTGSRVRRNKTCMTRAEWADLRRQNERKVDQGYTTQPET